MWEKSTHAVVLRPRIACDIEPREPEIVGGDEFRAFEGVKTPPHRPLPDAAGEPLQVTREHLTWRVAMWLDVSSKTDRIRLPKARMNAAQARVRSTNQIDL